MATINNFCSRTSNDATAETGQIKVPCNFTHIVFLYRHSIFFWYGKSHLWSQLLTFNTDARLLVLRPFSVRVFLGSEVWWLVERHTVTRCDVTDRLYHPGSYIVMMKPLLPGYTVSKHWSSVTTGRTSSVNITLFNDAQLPTEVSACSTPVHCTRPSQRFHSMYTCNLDREDLLFNLKDLKCPLSRAKEVCFLWKAVHNIHQLRNNKATFKLNFVINYKQEFIRV